MSSILNSALKNIGVHFHGNRGVDTKMRFSVDPMPGDSGFTQWCAAMQMVSRLPGGIPVEFRKRLWLTLADRHVQSKRIDWKKTKQTCLNEKTNPDDDKLGVQIVKDLHRTGCSMFSGEETEHNQALLKKVLLAYARWNKVVGYCQGFNMLAAIILEVMEWKEENALKVMIYLIEEVLPEGYFANHMRGLSVDMAVFRELLRMRFSILSQHLDRLQVEARDTSGAGSSYEPPLTNVFTMQWFLTLFSNCLPKVTVLRVWDLIFLEGNEVLLRTALSIWGGLADRVLTVESADEFYSIMGVLTREMLEFGIMDANDLIKTICTMTPLSMGELNDMRDKYAYNIRPLSSPFSSFKKNLKILYSDDEDECEDDNLAMATWCLSNTMQLPKSKGPMGFSDISPGAVSHGYGLGMTPHPSPSTNNVDSERMSLDISALKKQYAKLRERQKQAHVILTGALANHSFSRQRLPVAVNHLLVGKKPLVRKNKPTSRIIFEFKSPTKPAVNDSLTFPGSSHLTESPATIQKRQSHGGGSNDTGTTLSWPEAKLERQKLKAEQKRLDKDSDNIVFAGHLSDSSSCSSSSTELCDDEDLPSISDYAPSPDSMRKSLQIGIDNSVIVTVTSDDDSCSGSPDSSTFTVSENQGINSSNVISPASTNTLVSEDYCGIRDNGGEVNRGTIGGDEYGFLTNRNECVVSPDRNTFSPYDSNSETRINTPENIIFGSERDSSSNSALGSSDYNSHQSGNTDFSKIIITEETSALQEEEESDSGKFDISKIILDRKSSNTSDVKSNYSEYLSKKYSSDNRFDLSKILERKSSIESKTEETESKFDYAKFLARRASLKDEENKLDVSRFAERKSSQEENTFEISMFSSSQRENESKFDVIGKKSMNENKSFSTMRNETGSESDSYEDRRETISKYVVAQIPDDNNYDEKVEEPQQQPEVKFDYSKFLARRLSQQPDEESKFDISKFLERRRSSTQHDGSVFEFPKITSNRKVSIDNTCRYSPNISSNSDDEIKFPTSLPNSDLLTVDELDQESQNRTTFRDEKNTPTKVILKSSIDPNLSEYSQSSELLERLGSSREDNVADKYLQRSEFSETVVAINSFPRDEQYSTEDKIDSPKYSSVNKVNRKKYAGNLSSATSSDKIDVSKWLDSSLQKVEQEQKSSSRIEENKIDISKWLDKSERDETAISKLSDLTSSIELDESNTSIRNRPLGGATSPIATKSLYDVDAIEQNTATSQNTLVFNPFPTYKITSHLASAPNNEKENTTSSLNKGHSFKQKFQFSKR